MSKFNRPSRSTSALHLTEPSSLRLDTLEPRQLLAADLGVGFDSSTSIPATIVPGDVLEVRLTVANQGDRNVDGRATVNFYLSKDEVFDADDVLAQSFADRRVQLAAGSQTDEPVEFPVTVPTVDVPVTGEGVRYFLLVRIVPASNIGDLNQTNNTASNGTGVPLKWNFGNFDNRTGVTMTLISADGVSVLFGLTGPGKGTVVRDTTNTDRFDVAVENSGAASRMGIGADGGTGPNAGIALIDDITITGSIGLLDASGARLLGDTKISGTAATVRFQQIQGPALLDIRGGGVNTVMELGTVSNLVVTKAGGIASLTVRSWSDTDTALDRLTATFIGTINSTGNFQPSLALSGRSSGRTLDNVNIGGRAAKGSWDVNGRAGKWTIKTTADTWAASVQGNVLSLTTTSTFRGAFAAKSITTLTLGGLSNARILAGADLGADARLGGTGADIDTFAGGNITTVRINGSVVNSIVGAGLNPVDGVIKNGDDQLFSGRIDSIVVTKTVDTGSRFLARRLNGPGPYRVKGRAVDTTTDPRFKLDVATPPTATDISLKPADFPTAIQFTLTDADGIDVSSLGNGDLLLMRPDGSTVALSYVFPATPPANGPSVAVEYVISPPGGVWDTPDNGVYQVLIVAGEIKDINGGAAAAGQIATFTIAL